MIRIVCVKVVGLVDSEDSICNVSCNVALDAFSADVSDCEEICSGSYDGVVGSGSSCCTSLSNASFHRLQHVFISSLMSSLGHKKLSEISQFWNIVHIGSQFLVNENGCSIQN